MVFCTYSATGDDYLAHSYCISIFTFEYKALPSNRDWLGSKINCRCLIQHFLFFSVEIYKYNIMKRAVASIADIQAKKVRSVEPWKQLFTGTLPNCPDSVVALDKVLPAGQAFRWKKIGSKWRGVIGNFIYDLTQLEREIQYEAKTELSIEETGHIDANKILNSYFNLHIDHDDLLQTWKVKDVNFQEVSFDGCRVIAVEPVECLYSFICSANNNIPRISKMVSFLAQKYGKKLGTIEDVDYYSFPKPSQLLATNVEKILRDNGFGYRAAYIAKTSTMLHGLGGEEYLLNLKSPSVTYSTASDCLVKLHGIGRKVADCICLMSLSKFESVPIDTHVFQIAMKLYDIPSLSSMKRKTKVNMSASLYHEIGDHFRSLWGSHAGWAQQILFTRRVLERHNNFSQN